MKVLVYGVGVIGCELAHVLKKGGNDVTLLARGDWKDTLEKRGLVIRHYLQRKTTVDKVTVTGCLHPDDQYDIIFVVMQADQVPSVLSALAANVSRYVVFIGNNPWAEKTENMLRTDSPVKKEAAFGFMTSGGRRENGQVISIHVRAHLTVGARDGKLTRGFGKRLIKAFSGTGCRLTWENQMDAWLKCHMAEILPLGYVSYAVSCNLKNASKRQRRAMVDATAEGFSLLKALGYPIRPAEDEPLFMGGAKRMLWQAAMFVMCKTPLGRLAVTDHCAHAVSEMSMLDRAWEEMRAENTDLFVDVTMPIWDSLRKSMPANDDGKVLRMTDAEIESIAEAFADYRYEDDEKGLFDLFPDKEAVKVYMRAFVRAGVRMGWLHTTSGRREGYILFHEAGENPSASAALEIVKGCLRSLGLKGSIAYLKKLSRGGKSLESRMKKEKKKFIKIELVAVTKPYQGQGYLRKTLDIAFRAGQEKKVPCILDTDGRLKRDKYIRVGMQLAGTRKIEEDLYLYDLIKTTEQ
ncbi:MAG: NAD-binding protein [Bacteroidales bacterium]|nr:NAD-binding protein [Bacteroidales bacterium]MCM1416917.1 NAD-binding protein [bacterium]MCM1424724.1 NAD-binding protein [bacterium]